MKPIRLTKDAKNAIMIGFLCAMSYLAVYIARNMLTAATPQILETGAFSENDLGILSSIYFITYACGQLINGVVGDKIKAKYMISFGLILAGLSNAAFSGLSHNPVACYIAYGSSGFFLSMIYGPMTKVVAENTNPIYATRCSVAYTFASLIGTPIAGFVAVLVAWYTAFMVSSVSLILMGLCCLVGFLILEKKGIVTYPKVTVKSPQKTGKFRILLKRQILKFTMISIVTGVVRTAVIFWLPTYLEQHLGFSPNNATLLFTLCTSIMSVTAFLAVFTYELLRRNMDLSLLIYFSVSTLGFLAVLLVKLPVLNIILLIIAIIASKCADSLMWSRYCPSLYDTGLTSTATGYLDFVSYMAAATASSIFPHAKAYIGWNGLILVWVGLMAIGVLLCLPRKKA